MIISMLPDLKLQVSVETGYPEHRNCQGVIGLLDRKFWHLTAQHAYDGVTFTSYWIHCWVFSYHVETALLIMLASIA